MDDTPQYLSTFLSNTKNTVINILKDRLSILIITLLLIQAVISAVLLILISNVITKANWTYHYDIPKYDLITKLGILHEHRFHNFVMLLHERDQNAKQHIIDNMKNSSVKVSTLLNQLKSLPHLPEDEIMINNYLSLRKQIVDIREKQIMPQILSGNNENAVNLSKKILYPLLEKRCKLIPEMSTQIAFRGKKASHDISLIAKRAYITAAVVFLFSVTMSFWFFLLYRRTLNLHREAEKQRHQIEALRITMNTVYDIVLNAFNNLQSLRYKISNNKTVSEDQLKTFNMIISEAVDKLRELGSVERYETYEAAKGINIVHIPPKQKK